MSERYYATLGGTAKGNSLASHRGTKAVFIYSFFREGKSMYRTEHGGLVTKDRVGERMMVSGWVFHKRDMGGVIFLDVRDHTGVLQVVLNRTNLNEDAFKAAENVKLESVVRVEGLLQLRDEETYNEKLKTGAVELRADAFDVLSEADPLPFSLEDGARIREDLRMEYRFLDLRRAEMQHALRFRHKIVKAARDYLDAEGFVDVETPILTKSTPEGARDYLVPSRVHPGEFYALPQSPQIFKQLLMVGGLDRYYQVARCFRDEDLRADRQPEFTQLDMELAFVTQEDILVHLEKLFKSLMKSVMDMDLEKPFLRLTWQQAMDQYGSDKPDLRFDMQIIDVTDIARNSGFSVFEGAAKKGGSVRALNVKGGARFTKTEIEFLTERALHYGAKGMAWIMLREDGSVNSILKKFLTQEAWDAIVTRTGMENGDFLLFCADKLPTVRRTLGGLRLDIADMLSLRDKSKFAFLFVTDFPEFEYSEEEKRFVAMHHPFTMPYEEDLPYLFSDPARVRAQAYDVVLNGVELGSGSVRIHSSDVQKMMFRALGFSDAEAEQRFGFFVRAFRYGTPPHGGFAFGLDRLVMLLSGAESLRDVTAFPKTKDAKCLLTGAPDVVDDVQLKELSISTRLSGALAQETSAKKAETMGFDIARTAQLASLSLDDAEKAALQKELSGILAFASELNSLDTTGVIPTAHAIPLKNVLREDRAMEFPPAPLLQNAPELHGGYIRVPAAIKQEDTL